MTTNNNQWTITMTFEASLELQSYINRRVECAKRLKPSSSENEQQRMQRLYCAANDLALLKPTRKGKLRWIGTELLADESDESLADVRCYDDLMEEFGNPTVAFTARVVIERFIESVKVDGAHRIPCNLDFDSVFEWWAGTGLVEGIDGEWVLSLAFYERKCDLLGPRQNRKQVDRQLKNVPTFRRWVRKQFDRPRVCSSLRRTMDQKSFEGHYLSGLELWLSETAGNSEPYLDSQGNLGWRAKLAI
jgi:hypothetical protein